MLQRVCLKWRHRTEFNVAAGSAKQESAAVQYTNSLALDKQQNDLVKSQYRSLSRTIEIGLRSKRKASVTAAVTALCIRWRSRAQWKELTADHRQNIFRVVNILVDKKIETSCLVKAQIMLLQWRE